MEAPSNVVSIGTAKSIVPGESVRSVVEMLEEYLDMAQKGELIQVLLVGVKPPGNMSSDWAGNATVDQCLAAVHGLTARVTAEWLASLDR